MPRTMFGHQRHYHLLPIYALDLLLVGSRDLYNALRGWFSVAVKWSFLLGGAPDQFPGIDRVPPFRFQGIDGVVPPT